MKHYSFFSILIVLSLMTSLPGWAEESLKPSDWTARWIALLEDPYPDSTLTHPAPYFRKPIVVGKPIKKAMVYVCGLGFYEMYINGEKIGDQVLAPAVTNYDRRSLKKILYHYDDQSTQRVLYNTFDVTETLQKGENTLGVLLGNGWYNQRDRTVEGRLWYDTPRLLLQLEIEYTDGTKDRIGTDKTWKCTTGPLLHDAIFTGETQDARLDLGAWNKNDYDDAAWKSALIAKAPTGKLCPQLAPFDKITRTLQPTFEGQINDSTYRYKLPEMISGWAELHVKGKAGNQVKLRFIGEEGEDFGQLDTYILKGKGMESWEPRFTWHTFRYIEAITQDVKMDKESLIAKVVHTDVLQTGHFECSNELFNKVNESYLRTQKANFHGSISSDCPHRERLAYTGDAQVIVESSLLSFDMAQFYRKWFDDMEAVFTALLTQLKEINHHFDTGILATPLLLEVLTDNGRADLAYKIMDQRSAPGFSYLLNDTYSCLWERWDGKESRCHPMFGSVVAWFYKTPGGIRVDASEPDRIWIAPHPVGELTYCKSSYSSVYGMIRSDWRIHNGSFELTVEIPANTTATIQLPCEDNSRITESGLPLDKTDHVMAIGTEGRSSVVKVSSGVYHFVGKLND